MSYREEVKLLGLPTPERNDRRHWAAVMKERTGWHRAVWFAFLGRRPILPLMRARVVFTRHSATRPDPAQLVESWKAVEDGLVNAAVLVDDRAENYVGEAPEYRWEHAPQGRGFITIEVEEEIPHDGSSKEESDEEEDHDEDGRSDHDHRPEHPEERGTQ